MSTHGTPPTPSTEQDWQRLTEKMYRVDRAVGILRSRRVNRKDADELIAASLNLMNEIRLQHNEKWLRRDLETDPL